MFSLLLSGRPPTASNLMPDSQTDQDVVVNVPHPSGVKFLFCKLLYLLDFDQISAIRARWLPNCASARCDCLSSRSWSHAAMSARRLSGPPEIGDMVAFLSPELPERFVTCHF